MRGFLREVWHKASDYFLHWATTGVLIALFGFAPERWLEDLFHDRHGLDFFRWLAPQDFRVIAVITGVVIVVLDMHFRLRSFGNKDGTASDSNAENFGQNDNTPGVPKSPDPSANRPPRATNFEVRQIARESDLNAVYAIDNYPGHENIPPELFHEWWMAYSIGFLAGYEKNKPIAVIGLFPVTQQWAEALKRHKVTERDLKRGIIEDGKKLRTVWYLSGISIQESEKIRGPSWRAAKLACQCFQRLYAENHEVIRTGGIRLVSAGATEMGRKLLDHYGFTLVTRADEARQLDPIYERTMTESNFIDLFLGDKVCSQVCDPILLMDFKRRSRSIDKIARRHSN